jgi:hypothetical protein
MSLQCKFLQSPGLSDRDGLHRRSESWPATCFLTRSFNMKSNRMRVFSHAKGRDLARWQIDREGGIDLESMPRPEPVLKPNPEKIVEDVLMATLRRLQEDGNQEIAAVAARYLELLRPVG